MKTQPQCSQCERAGKSCSYDLPVLRIFELAAGPEFNSDFERQSFAYFVKEGATIITTFQPFARAV
jgi:hypothetical protein